MHDCYDIIRKIGFGGFSVIWLAQRKPDAPTALPYHIAMKRIRKNKLPIHHIWQEISVMKQFNHPNILRLYDVLESEHEITLLLEYCNGGDLSDLTDDDLADNDKLFDIVSQILTGWKYVKGLDKQLIHRDIKLQNILLHRKDNGQIIVKIADFGFCMPGQKYEIKQKKMMEMTICGSPYYMAPEMFQNASVVLDQYDDRIDIWSLGIIIYKLLNGLSSHPLGDIRDIQTLIALYHDPQVQTKWQMNLDHNICKKCTVHDKPCNRCFLFILMKGMLEISRECRLKWDEIFQMIQKHTSGPNCIHTPIYENYYNPRMYNHSHIPKVTVDISYYQKNEKWYEILLSLAYGRHEK